MMQLETTIHARLEACARTAQHENLTFHMRFDTFHINTALLYITAVLKYDGG